MPYMGLVVTALAPKVLIQQQIAFMGAIGKIIQHKQSPRTLAGPSFPLRVDAIVINHQPIDSTSLFQHAFAIDRVFFLCGA
jgi:hypothetical protein